MKRRRKRRSEKRLKGQESPRERGWEKKKRWILLARVKDEQK